MRSTVKDYSEEKDLSQNLTYWETNVRADSPKEVGLMISKEMQVFRRKLMDSHPKSLSRDHKYFGIYISQFSNCPIVLGKTHIQHPTRVKRAVCLVSTSRHSSVTQKPLGSLGTPGILALCEKPDWIHVRKVSQEAGIKSDRAANIPG